MECLAAEAEYAISSATASTRRSRDPRARRRAADPWASEEAMPKRPGTVADKVVDP